MIKSLNTGKFKSADAGQPPAMVTTSNRKDIRTKDWGISSQYNSVFPYWYMTNLFFWQLRTIVSVPSIFIEMG